MRNPYPSRRDVIKATAATLAVGPMTAWGGRPTQESKTKVFLFSKHLQWLDYPQMAETAAQLGVDGLDLTVRPGGHVEPQRVKEDLPRAVAAMRTAGLGIDMMTTAIRDAHDPQTREVLTTAAGLGFRHYRMGWFKYDLKKPLPAQLEKLKPVVKALADLNQKLGLFGAYQNHAGRNYVGAAVWDLWQLLQGIDPRSLGSHYDIRHATVEGGQSWPSTLLLILPHITSLAIKDFYWHKGAKGWAPQNCPLGEGMVDFTQYFKRIKQAGLQVPVSLHLEYELGGANHGARELSLPKEEVLARMRRDVETLRAMLTQSGL